MSKDELLEDQTTERKEGRFSGRSYASELKSALEAFLCFIGLLVLVAYAYWRGDR